MAELEDAGYLEQFTNEQGEPAMRLTPEGEKVARQLAMLRRGEPGRVCRTCLRETGDP